MSPRLWLYALGLASCLSLAGCLAHRTDYPHANSQFLTVVAEFPQRQVTGVAVSSRGRIFVNFPYWSADRQNQVMELRSDGSLLPYPDAVWNNWDGLVGGSSLRGFVCVQSVYVDDQDHLWILDAGNPKLMRGVVPGGPKLLEINLADNRLVQAIYFDDKTAPKHSYLNDVRVDTQRRYAYITDSGLGALVVVDLQTKSARRVLENHASTKSEDIALKVGGRWWLAPFGIKPKVHADGIALSADGGTLFYRPLISRKLYRVPTQALRDPALAPEELAQTVQDVGELPASDGLWIDKAGYLYLTALELDAIVRLTPAGKQEILVRDPKIKWPDSLAQGPDGSLYFTSSQIHLGMPFNWGVNRTNEPYRLFKIPLPAPAEE
ncbi:MAG: hypothetical protein IT443_10055 [Phycisphaeraceae bacterium]|nr:hypothetical protein [Phycisphaeraceae bacterium]